MGYGLLLTCLGLGAILGVLLLAHLRRAVALNTLFGGAPVLFGVALEHALDDGGAPGYESRPACRVV